MSFLDHVSFHRPKEHLLVWCFAFLSVFVVRGIFSLKVEAGSGTLQCLFFFSHSVMPCFYLVSRLLRYVVLQFPDQSYFTRYRMESMGEYTFIKAVMIEKLKLLSE